MTEYKIKLLPSQSFLDFKTERESGNQVRLSGLEVDYITSDRTTLTNSNLTPAEVEREFRLVSGGFNDVIRTSGDLVTAYRIKPNYYKLEFINRFYNKSFSGFIMKFKKSGTTSYVPAFLASKVNGSQQLFTERAITTISIYANIPDAIMEGYYTPTVDVSRFLLPGDESQITFANDQLSTVAVVDTYLDTVAQHLPAYRNGTYFDDSNKVVHMKVLGGVPYDYRTILSMLMGTLSSSVKSFGNVVDNLDGTDPRDALAATQGGVLNKMKLNIGDFSDWSNVNTEDVPIFKKSDGTVVTPSSLREFYEVLMEVLDNRSLTRVYPVDNFSDSSHVVKIPHNLSNKWQGVSSITNAFRHEDDTRLEPLDDATLKMEIDHQHIILTLKPTSLNSKFQAGGGTPKILDPAGKKRGRITIIIDKKALPPEGIPPVLKINKTKIIRPTTETSKLVTVKGTIDYSSGTKLDKLIVTGLPVVGTPRFTQDAHDPTLYNVEFDVTAEDNQTKQITVQGFALFNGDELPSNVVTTEVTLERIVKPQLINNRNTIEYSFDSNNENREIRFAPSHLYVRTHLNFKPYKIKIVSTPNELKELFPVGGVFDEQVYSLLQKQLPDLNKLKKDKTVKLVIQITDIAGFNAGNWSDPYEININLKDEYVWIKWKDASSIVDKYINNTVAYKDYKALPTAPVEYELEVLKDTNHNHNLAVEIINLRGDQTKYAPYIKIQGGKLVVDYQEIAKLMDQSNIEENIEFSVRVTSKKTDGNYWYYGGNPIMIIKNVSLKVHSNAVLVLTLKNFGVHGVNVKGDGKEISHLNAADNKFVYRVPPKNRNKWEVEDIMSLRFFWDGASDSTYHVNRPPQYADAVDSKYFRTLLTFDDTIDPGNLIKEYRLEVVKLDGSGNPTEEWKNKIEKFAWSTRYGALGPDASPGVIKEGNRKYLYIAGMRSDQAGKVFAIRAHYTITVNGVDYERVTPILRVDLSELGNQLYYINLNKPWEDNNKGTKFYAPWGVPSGRDYMVEVEFKPAKGEVSTESQLKVDITTNLVTSAYNETTVREANPITTQVTMVKDTNTGIFRGMFPRSATSATKGLTFSYPKFSADQRDKIMNGKFRVATYNSGQLNEPSAKVWTDWLWSLDRMGGIKEFVNFVESSQEMPTLFGKEYRGPSWSAHKGDLLGQGPRDPHPELLDQVSYVSQFISQDPAKNNKWVKTSENIDTYNKPCTLVDWYADIGHMGPGGLQLEDPDNPHSSYIGRWESRDLAGTVTKYNVSYFSLVVKNEDGSYYYPANIQDWTYCKANGYPNYQY